MADGNEDYEIVDHDSAQHSERRDLTSHLPDNASIVERAVFAGMPLDMVNQLRAMVKEDREEAAKLAFMADLVAAKEEMPRVYKGRANSHTRSKYADLAAIDEAITPVITKHGFTTHTKATTSSVPGHISVTFTTVHKEGHSEEFTLDWALDGEGMKGNSNKTPVQAMKSTITFARRTMKMMAFDIADTDDNDGNSTNPARNPERKTIGRDQMDELDALLTEWGGDRGTFFEFFNVSGMGEIAESQFEKARDLLTKKIAAKAKPQATEQEQ